MTAFNENNLNDQDENLRINRQNGHIHADQLGEIKGESALEKDNPFTMSENPSDNGRVNTQSDDEQFINEEFGENSGLLKSNIMNDSSITPGSDEDDIDDDLDLNDDDDDTLIPIKGDDDDLLDADGDDDIVPGTDMDNDDLIDDDDDEMDEDDSAKRSNF